MSSPVDCSGSHIFGSFEPRDSAGISRSCWDNSLSASLLGGADEYKAKLKEVEGGLVEAESLVRAQQTQTEIHES